MIADSALTKRFFAVFVSIFRKRSFKQKDSVCWLAFQEKRLFFVRIKERVPLEKTCMKRVVLFFYLLLVCAKSTVLLAATKHHTKYCPSLYPSSVVHKKPCKAFAHKRSSVSLKKGRCKACLRLMAKKRRRFRGLRTCQRRHKCRLESRMRRVFIRQMLRHSHRRSCWC